MNRIELSIEGMKCAGCVNRIKNILSSIEGIDSFDISLEKKILVLLVKKEKIVDDVIKRIESLGFVVSR